MVVVRRALAALALLTFGCSESPTPSDGGVLRDAGSRIDASSSDAGLGDAGSIDAGTDAGGPALLPDVVRIAYNFSVPNARPGVEAANLLANLQVIALTDLDSRPERVRALYEGRRELGDDCAVYVEEDRSPVTSGFDMFSSAFAGGGDIDVITVSFDDVGGTALLATSLTYDTAAGRYPVYTRNVEIYPPFPTPGSVRIVTAGSTSIPSTTTTHPVVPHQIAYDGSTPWSATGLSLPIEVFDHPGAYLTFTLIGTEAKATVVCAGAGSGGNLTLRVPDLTALLSEIGRDGSAPDSVGLGLTDVVDPLLSGPYGLVEQAVNGPARVVEWRRDYLLFW